MKITFTTLMLLWVTTIFSQYFNHQKMDRLFSILEANKKFMGSVALSRNGETIYSHSVGYSNLADSIEANNLTKYRIGSISKVFTATLTMKAAEDGKLSLEDPLAMYFPEIRNSDSISIKNMLNHSSGIFDFTREKDYLDWNTDYQSRAAMLQRISQGQPAFDPVTTTGYSNSNYVLLSFILEDIYQHSFSKLLAEKITDPLGLKNTFYGDTIAKENNEAQSYSYLGNWEKDVETNLSIPMGAGGIVSTPQDLNTFMEYLFEGEIISSESLNKMKTIEGGFGLGLFKFPYNAKVSYGHTGGIDGFRSVSSYFPEEKLAISLFSNALNYGNNDILLAALVNYFNEPFELPEFETFEVTAEDIEQFTGNYSSTEIPPKITISQEGNVLIG
jgi:CubicO group peptidase (beta-lactamase class C family)